MVRIAVFEIMWILFFFIPLFLGISDSRFLNITIGFLIFEIWRVWTRLTGVEWVPSPNHIVDKMLKLANVKRNSLVYDLGSGDGKIVLRAAKLGARAIGVEIDPLRVLISKIKIKLFKLDKHAKIVHGNFFKTDVKNADVVTLFLLPNVMEKLENKLRNNLRKGARIVSYRFVFKNLKPIKSDEENRVYLYKV